MEEKKVCAACGQEKPVGEFWKNKWGVTDTCRACAVKKQNEKKKPKLEKRRLDKLADYTPRELLVELKRRGYKWEKMVVVTEQVVDFYKI